jgi:hypothetical protein
MLEEAEYELVSVGVKQLAYIVRTAPSLEWQSLSSNFMELPFAKQRDRPSVYLRKSSRCIGALVTKPRVRRSYLYVLALNVALFAFATHDILHVGLLQWWATDYWFPFILTLAKPIMCPIATLVKRYRRIAELVHLHRYVLPFTYVCRSMLG